MIGHHSHDTNMTLHGSPLGAKTEGSAGFPSGGERISWTTVQVGGDVVYRGNSSVMRGSEIVGKPVSDGVVEFDDNHKPQAVGVFSLDASGTYGFRAQPSPITGEPIRQM